MEEKTRDEVSVDELCYRELLKEEFKIKPTKKAVEILESRIKEVLTKLGVNTDTDGDSLRRQMALMNIHISSFGDEYPKAAGLYISAIINSVLQPYAYISAAKLERGGYRFPIYYWLEEKLDEGIMEKV